MVLQELKNKDWGRHVSYASETDVDKKKKAADEQDKGTSAFDGMHFLFLMAWHFLCEKKAQSFSGHLNHFLPVISFFKLINGW